MARLTSLWGLPAFEGPFDRAKFRVPEVGAEQDALTLYRLAVAGFEPLGHNIWSDPVTKAVRGGWPSWPIAGRDIQAWSIKNRPVLDLWRQAAERPVISLRRPDEVDLLAPPTPDVFFLLAQLEASRLETEGRLDIVWQWQHTSLRMMRHVQDHDPLHRAADLQHQIFPGLLANVKRWATNPGVGVALLEKALRDVRSLNTPTTRGSEALKLEYLSIARRLEAPPDELVERGWGDLCTDGDDLLWYRHIPWFHESRWFIRDEPERSRRLANLVFVNWIASCESPASLWPVAAVWKPISAGGMPLVLLNASGTPGPPAPIAGLTGVELGRWHDSTLLFRHIYNDDLCYKLAAYQGHVIKRRVDLTRLTATLSDEVYARKHGG